MGKCQSQVLCRDLVLLLASNNLPKKFVAFPPHEHVNSLPKMSVTQDTADGTQSHVSQQREGCGVPNIQNKLRPLFFFFNLKISFAIPHSWHYRISYLSTRKVVSVENLTGLFPSTWVTLVTCRDNTYSEVSISHHFPTQEAQVSHSDTVKEDRTNPELVNRKSVFTKGFGQRMLR